MNADRLLAKSWHGGSPAPPHVFLPNHLQDVYAAADRVLDSTAADQLASLGLAPDNCRDRFRRIVLLAAAVHDLGKANDHFDGMIRGTRDVRERPQGLRHEWATVLMLRSLREWLLPAVAGSETDLAIVEWAIAGHHPAVNHPSPPRFCPPGAGTEIRLLTGHRDFAAVLDWLQETFVLSSKPTDAADHIRALVGSNNVFEELARWSRTSQQLWDRIKKSPDRLLVAAAKDCLIAADIAGSALAKTPLAEPGRWAWITTALGDKPEPGELQAIVDYRLNGSVPFGFQNEVARSSVPVTFVKAGCGSGKTLAAYMWAATNYPTRRLYFCYPTTGTATEGFKDYLFAPEDATREGDPNAEKVRQLGADLFHGRAEIDFEIILNTDEDAADANDELIRLDSLRAWNTPVVACTVDTVLGIVQNNRRGIFAWPALAQSAFVFDEIHAYDDRLFGALLRFLRDVPGVPALLMTASLPECRSEALRNVLAKMGRELNPIPGPVEHEKLPRYHRLAAPNNDPLQLVEETIHGGGKVLWVSNTVSRVLDAADRTKHLNPLVYHSRFKYVDRVERHKAVVTAFDPEHSGPVLACTSQVAEMSLDLKGCTLLVTDLATVPALIQRLGRLNRQARGGSPTMPFVVVEPDSHRPYMPADLDAARAWLAELPGTAVIAQKDLADLWEQGGDQPPDLVASAWLDGGPFTTATELREASPGITVIMRDDVSKVAARSKEMGRYAIPMPPPPRKQSWREWKRVHGVPVAENSVIEYESFRGAEWQKK